MTPELLASDIRDSLDRLQMERIDLYYLHRDEPGVPVDEIMDALHSHQQAGRIGHYAASNWFPARLEQAAAYCQRKSIPPFVASQCLYNLAQLSKPMPADICVVDAQQEQFYAKTKLPLVAYSPNANGYFAGAAHAAGSYDNPTSAGRRDRCAQLGKKLGATASQVALAYLMHQPFAVMPITGTNRVDHLQDALGAASVKLSTSDVAYLRG